MDVHVLVIEDDYKLLRLFKKTLSNEGYFVTTAATLQVARKYLLRAEYQLIVSDIELPDGNALTLLNDVRTLLEQYGTRVIFVSGNDARRHEPIVHEIAEWFLTKPVSMRQLVAVVHGIFVV